MNKKLAFIIAALAIIGAAIWYFSTIFFYFITSVVLATVLRPLTNQVNKIEFLGGRLPRYVAIFAGFAVILSIFGFFILLFVPLISNQVEVINSLNFSVVIESLIQPIKWIEKVLIENNLSERAPGFMVDSVRIAVIDFIRGIDFTSVLNKVIALTGNIFIGVLAIAFITFFLLYENGILRRQLIAMIPNQYFEVFISAIYKIERLLSNFLIGILAQMLSIFSMAAIGLMVLGVNYAATIAVFAAVANLVPYLGPLLGGLFGVAVAVSTSGDFTFSTENIWMITKVMSVFVVVQVADNLLLQPLIFSKSVKAHPLEIFVVIFVGATIAGIAGMVVAIPVYTVLRVSASEIYTGFNQYRVFKSKS